MTVAGAQGPQRNRGESDEPSGLTVKRAMVGVGYVADGFQFLVVVAIILGVVLRQPLILVLALQIAVLSLAARLLLRPASGPGLLERRALQSYYRQELEGAVADLPVGLADNGSIAREEMGYPDSLYVEPTYALVRVTKPPAGKFLEWIGSELNGARSVLLLGDAGEGKTLTCRLIYRQLARQFCAHPRQSPIPLLISLIDARGRLSDEASAGNPLRAIAHLVKEDGARLPIGESRLLEFMRRRKVVLIIDGLDELSVVGATTPAGLPRALEAAVKLPTVLTCRRAFYDFNLSGSHSLRSIGSVAALKGVEWATEGKSFVKKYCSEFGLPSADAVISLIDASPSLLDLVTRPLTMFMVTDVLSHQLASSKAGEPVEPERWTMTKVYQGYTTRWLDRERDKGALLSRVEMESLSELIAWDIYDAAARSGRAFGQILASEVLIGERSLSEVVKQLDSELPFETVYGQATTRLFLVKAATEGYFRFAHKSFYEYFVAKHVLTVLGRSKSSQAASRAVLKSPLPDEMIYFVRQMLAQTAVVERERVSTRDHLFAVVEAKLTSENDGDRMARQQAANLLPLTLKLDKTGRDRLMRIYRTETDPFVRRGIAVGFALHLDDGSLIDELIDDFDRNPEALQYHLGYNRVYYGDQAVGSSGWRDDGTPQCERIFRATLAQLRRPEYSSLWPMSVRTAYVLLSNPSRNMWLAAHMDMRESLTYLASFAQAHFDSPRPSLARECQRLAAFMGSAASDDDPSEGAA